MNCVNICAEIIRQGAIFVFLYVSLMKTLLLAEPDLGGTEPVTSVCRFIQKLKSVRKSLTQTADQLSDQRSVNCPVERQLKVVSVALSSNHGNK